MLVLQKTDYFYTFFYQILFHKQNFSFVCHNVLFLSVLF